MHNVGRAGAAGLRLAAPHAPGPPAVAASPAMLRLRPGTVTENSAGTHREAVRRVICSDRNAPSEAKGSEGR